MGIPPASLALSVLAVLMIFSGIIIAALAESLAKEVSTTQETLLKATRSRYLLSQVGGATMCGAEEDGCDGSCDPIDLSSSVPTFAYFRFYNITNPDDVNLNGGAPVLNEIGPYTCLTAPPVMTARMTWTSSPASASDTTSEFEPQLGCDAVNGGGGDIVYLYDKASGAVIGNAVTEWVDDIKANILGPGGTVGAGGAPSFHSYAAHGNESFPNDYMRRASDDAPVLPLFPHAYLPDGKFLLEIYLTSSSIIQWFISSIGQTVSFTWMYPLYLTDPVRDRFLNARFATYLTELDLTSRGSNFYDSAYSYYRCVASGTSTSVQLEAAVEASYPLCTSPPEDEILSHDDFFIDVNLITGIPTPIRDIDGAGGWQAWQYPSLGISDASGNCSGTYADPGIAGFGNMPLWSWGFWSGNLPYVSHSEKGYDPLDFGAQGKWLAEFGVSRNGVTLPAFAFSMMPKMMIFLSPNNLGVAYPFDLMGDSEVDIKKKVFESFGVDAAGSDTTYMWMNGKAAAFYLTFYGHGVYSMYLACGLFLIIFSILITLPVAAVRFKMDSQATG